MANYTGENPPWSQDTLENYKGTAIYQKGERSLSFGFVIQGFYTQVFFSLNSLILLIIIYIVARDATVGKMVTNTLFAIWAGYEVSMNLNWH